MAKSNENINKQLSFSKIKNNQVWKDKSSYQNYPLINVKYRGKHIDYKSNSNRLIRYKKNDKLGEGGFGVVYEGQVYTISYKLKQVIYKKDKVVKVMRHVAEEMKELILTEYAQGQKAPQLGMKTPVFTGKLGKQTCYLVMNKLPGKEMFDFVLDDTIASMRVDKKLKFTYKLLLALRDQVKNIGIVHRDLKPENIMVQLEPELIVNIIDYGLSKEKDTHDGRRVGSPAYVAPEMISGHKHDVACDVFSMAKVIALLWINDLYLYKPLPWQMEEFSNDSANAIQYIQGNDLMKNPDILDMLEKMLNPNQYTRCTIDEAIEMFEKAYPQFDNSFIEEPNKKVNKSQIIQLVRSDEDKERIEKIKIYIKDLESYANTMTSSDRESKQTVLGFVGDIKNIINDECKNLKDIKNECLNKLSDKNLKSCAKQHKKVSHVLKNIAAAVIGLGVFYGIACGINKLVTGRATFFHNKISDARHDLFKEIKSIKMVS